MINTKTWDDYLTESAKSEEANSPKPLSHRGTVYKLTGNGSRNPFLNTTTERDESTVAETLNVITSEPVISTTTETSSTETVLLRNPCDKSTLDSLDSLDSYGYGETKARERFLLFDNRESTPARKEVFAEHLRGVMRQPRDENIRPKIFGGNFKFMKGYLKSALPLSEVEKENKSTSENPSTNDVVIDLTAKLQQELKSCRRKIQNLKELNVMAVRRKDELQDEVLTVHKDITDLKIALQLSCDKQHEYEIEMRIAKARVGEAEREAAIAIGQSNKLEREVQEAERNRQSNWDKLNTAEQKINSLVEKLSTSKEAHRQDTERRNQFEQQLDGKEHQLRRSEKEVQSLKVVVNEKEEERLSLAHQFDHVMQEKAKCEGQIEELTKSSVSLKHERDELQTSKSKSERVIETCNQRVEQQKVKFEAMIASRVQIESEINQMHKELSRQKNEKQILSTECSRLLESLNTSEAHSERVQKQYEALEKESSNLKDKILYLELYKKVIDTKALSLDELKTPKTSAVTIAKDNLRKSMKKHNTSLVSEKPKSEVDLEMMTKNLGEIRKNVDRAVIKSSLPTNRYSIKEVTSGNQSPFELSINERKQSIFPTFMTSINREESFSNMFSDLIGADNKNIANALL